jgi:hypothetical protein
MRKSFTTSKFLAFAALAAIAGLAACGGGGGSASAPVARASPAPITTAGSGLAKASFSIKIPSATAASASRQTRTIDPATSSISFTLLKTTAAGVPTPGTAVTSDVSAASPLCTAVTGGRTCTVALIAPIGDDIYSVQTFSATGVQIGSSAVNLTVLENVANTATIVIGGALAGVVMSTISGQSGDAETPLDWLGVNFPSSVRLVLIGVDAQGNAILNPGTFSTPITLGFQSFLFEDSHARRTKGAITAQPAMLQLTVAYANPNGGPATATTTDVGPPITVTSPNDVVTVTALSPGPTTLIRNTGVVAVVGAATTIPSSPFPASGLTFSVFPSGPFTFNVTDGQIGLTGPQDFQSFQFPTASAALVNFSVSESVAGVMQTGPITLALQETSAPCVGYFDLPKLPTTLNTANAFSFQLETAAHGTGDGPTQGVTCHLQVTDAAGLFGTLTVNVNNPELSVQ